LKQFPALKLNKKLFKNRYLSKCSRLKRKKCLASEPDRGRVGTPKRNRRFETMPTPCTSPAAPFYELDIAFLSVLESAGIDMPCELIAPILAGAIGFAAVAIALVGLATSTLLELRRLRKANAARNRRLNKLFESARYI
jgi:hypothetical protein